MLTLKIGAISESQILSRLSRRSYCARDKSCEVENILHRNSGSSCTTMPSSIANVFKENLYSTIHHSHPAQTLQMHRTVEICTTCGLYSSVNDINSSGIHQNIILPLSIIYRLIAGNYHHIVDHKLLIVRLLQFQSICWIHFSLTGMYC